MSARPPFEDLPPDPLDAQESALASRYRKLSSAGPSAELDARILAQARAAVAPARRKRRPWFLGARAGAAAAAVMAAGVAWQLGWIGGIPGAVMSPGASLPEDARRQAPKDDAALEEERVDIEFVREARKTEVADPAATSASPAAPAPPLRQKLALPPPPPPAPTPAAEAPMPAAAGADAQRDAAPAVRSEPIPEPFPASPPAAAGRAADAPLGATAAAQSAEGRRANEQESADVGRERDDLLPQHTTLPPWTQDETLAPAQWLERIRERVDVGDRQGAVFSLRRFVQLHPQHPVPREIQRLLVE